MPKPSEKPTVAKSYRVVDTDEEGNPRDTEDVWISVHVEKPDGTGMDVFWAQIGSDQGDFLYDRVKKHYGKEIVAPEFNEAMRVGILAEMDRQMVEKKKDEFLKKLRNTEKLALKRSNSSFGQENRKSRRGL